MEIIILLKLEADLEKLKENNDTDNNVKSKIRGYIACIVGDIMAKEEYITLLSSSLASEIEPTGTVQIQPSNRVLRVPDDMEIE